MSDKTDISEITKIIENQNVKVSVVMPIYNACRYLRPAMDSILQQTLKDIEIICVDDGSTDTSLDILRIYQKQDLRIRIITQTNAGPAIARNNGFKKARGEYVIFLDGDDFFENDMLEKLYNEAVQKDLDITICDYDIYHNKKSTFRANSVNPYAQIYDCGVVTSKNEQPDRILLSTTGAAWNKLFKKSFLIEKELSFLGDVMMFEDVYFTVCALAFAERVGKVPDVLLHHRIYSTQSRARTFKKYYSQVPEVYLKIKEFLMKGGMYQPLHSAFLNLSASRCYHVFNLLDSGSKEKFWKLLNEEYYQKLDWHEHSAEDFDNPEICEFIANMELYTYKQYQKRCAMGKHIDQDKMNMKLKQGHRYRRLREFCASYFKKKKK